ncbi:MAG: undecaprenyl-phosphate glucose phosphotransferase [Planctomycetes bacterium]|jgi:putative colanic acid biosynthesis UDP-glucose lipid carrier transferase|nr:undecaprenyl-phosphate glucose phosphotransferase [Planctomycetota bacterium]
MLVNSHAIGLRHGRTSVLGLVRMSLEPVLIVCSLVASCALVGTPFEPPELILSLIAFSLTFPGDVSVRRLRQSLFASIVANWALVFGLLMLLGYVTRFVWYFEPAMLWVWGLSTPIVLYAAHRAIPLVTPQLLAIDGNRRAVVIAANDVGRRLARSLRDEPSLGFRFAGFFHDDAEALSPDDGPLLGRIAAAAEHVKRNGVDAVFIALPMAAQPAVLKLLDELQDTTASIFFVPDIFIFDLIQARVDDINGVPVVAVCDTPFAGINGVVKNASDKLLAATLLLLAGPLMVCIAIAIKATSPGPVLFRQRRYGLDGREFHVFKFRSMAVNEDGPVIAQATRNDPRVTRLGGWLRKASLDELPQLFNVLEGKMSLVGPRPHAVAHNEMYRRVIKGYMIRHKVKPGITGWAQVNGYRGETDSVDKMRARVEYDLDYLRRWSVGLDLLIILKTIRIVLRQTNAY